jgi:hypothetical protein
MTETLYIYVFFSFNINIPPPFLIITQAAVGGQKENKEGRKELNIIVIILPENKT